MTLPPPAPLPQPVDPKELPATILRTARSAAKRIQETFSGDEIRLLREAFEALKQENQILRERLDAIEKRLPTPRVARVAKAGVAAEPVAPKPARAPRRAKAS